MPTYDYRCQRTGEMFELWQSFRDEALTVCTQVHDNEGKECGAPVKKVFSKVGISFKGEGFYKNDHGSNARARASEKSKSSSSSGESSTAKSESSSSTSDSGSSVNGSSTSKSNASSAA
ncbi:MAG: FmdB family transcriptional regulator [Acidimicrobiaceae bacterium]|nr:FmdB family transcriptional regulator [Acidimicrobiaceae bacterium]MXW60305.1 FmdB family transcriptional regulator [Acidimicrobiaceae bacterium]MXW76282.1 FmdB family transcriptional regulator [Acidimicrobiaceae bacterium]MYA74483.1 FmdB family transcriptional regulator [Acidimicrobiaceae bacterium]MYC43874.1 FmdB family transcriptional regulator [Acidimicrobiaceae bacterium]